MLQYFLGVTDNFEALYIKELTIDFSESTSLILCSESP